MKLWVLTCLQKSPVIYNVILWKVFFKDKNRYKSLYVVTGEPRLHWENGTELDKESRAWGQDRECSMPVGCRAGRGGSGQGGVPERTTLSQAEP